MPQIPAISLLRGGLDLITSQIAMPDGRAISCLNYEPDVSGYSSTGGYERFDGRTSPSSSTVAATVAALRALILAVPGSGPVRGVYVYAGLMWAFRDQVDGTAAMFKATAAGWVQQTFGHTIDFTAGTTEFEEDTVVTGGTSGVTATIKRVVVTSGFWDGTAAGYLVLSGITSGLLADTIVNGTFAVDANWTKGTNVTIAAGVATMTATPVNQVLSQAQALTAGTTYKLVFTVSGYSAGNVVPAFTGGTPVLGTSITANGTYTQFLTAGAGNTTLAFVAGSTTTLNIDNVTFQAVTTSFQAETITSASGSAHATAAEVAIALSPGGVYEFLTHNFYGAAKSARLYFVNGIGTAFEWDGTVLAPIRTGIDTGSTFGYLMTPAGSPNRVLTPDGGRIIVNSTAVDNPAYIGEFRNHLFFGYAVGAIVFSGPGVPLDYRTIAGAGTFAFGDAMTGMKVAATALIILGRGLIEYVAGNSVDDFQKLTITDSAGAVLRSPQVFAESPLYLDDGGLRKLSSSAAYGDFKTGSATQLLEPLFRQKRLAGIVPVTALVVTGKDQYRLYWNDGSGVVLYMGRKYPESLPFKLPATFFSSCVGELDPGMGDRLFAGGTDGYVYELDKGTSFDGVAIDAYIQITYNNLNSPRTNKRFHSYFGDVVCADPITVGVVFDVDYGSEPAEQTNVDATAGMPLVGTDAYASIDWQQAVQGQFTCDLDGVGRNIAVTHITSSSTARQHTFPASTINFSPRGSVRQ